VLTPSSSHKPPSSRRGCFARHCERAARRCRRCRVGRKRGVSRRPQWATARTAPFRPEEKPPSGAVGCDLNVRIAHIPDSMLTEVGLIERDFRKRDEGSRAPPRGSSPARDETQVRAFALGGLLLRGRTRDRSCPCCGTRRVTMDRAGWIDSEDWGISDAQAAAVGASVGSRSIPGSGERRRRELAVGVFLSEFARVGEYVVIVG